MKEDIIDLMSPTCYLDINPSVEIPFRVVLVRTADPSDARVEFFDQRFAFTEHGQFTGARYYADTLLGRDRYGTGRGGLNLNGGVPEWQIDAGTMEVVRAWLKIQLGYAAEWEFEDFLLGVDRGARTELRWPGSPFTHYPDTSFFDAGELVGAQTVAHHRRIEKQRRATI